MNGLRISRTDLRDITAALHVAARQYFEDARQCTGNDRLVIQSQKQGTDCVNLANRLEETDETQIIIGN